MANYSLIINSRFRPFEYQELLAPALMATQAHQAVEEAYADLSTKASIWDKMANEATDPKAHALYKKYADDLQSYSDQLAQYGLTPTSRQAMLNMRSRYAQDIVPIENAYKRKQAQMEEQRKALLQNPTLLLSRRAASTSLDDYLDNPNLDYESYSGALITQQVASAAANIAKEARDSEEGRRKLRQILPYQYEMMQQKGFSREAVMKAIMNSPDADKILTGLVEGAVEASGVKKWGDSTTLKKAYYHAREGLYSAIGETNYQMLTDQAGLIRLQHNLQNRNRRRPPGDPDNTGRINPLALRSKQEIAKINKYINFFKKKGYLKQNSDGQWLMTPEGWREYRATYNNDAKGWAMINKDSSIGQVKKAMQKAEKMPDKVPSAFRTFMDNLNGGKSFVDSKGNALPGWGPRRVGNLFASAIEKNKETSYDTYHSTEYDRQIPKSYGSEMMRQFKVAAPTVDGKKQLKVVDFNGKNGWKKTDYIKVEDLKDYSVSNIRYSKWGNTAFLQKEGEEPIRIEIPAGIHLGVEHNVKTAIANADEWGEILYRGKRPMTYEDNRGNLKVMKDALGNIAFTKDNLTEEDKTIFTQKQEEELSNIGLYGSQLVAPSVTSNEEYKPFF